MEAKIVSRYENMSDGYTRLYLSDQRVILEHRYVMEQKLGRRLRSTELVHHEDEDRGNNKIGNLVLTDRSKHRGEHAHGETLLDLRCAHCDKKFKRPARLVRTKQRQGQKAFFCSRSCAGSASCARPDVRARRAAPACGTYGAYRKGCRCVECRAANAARMRDYKKKRG